MPRLSRRAMLASLAAALTAVIGCSNEGKPNPDLKVPDVPPSPRGRGGDKGDMKQPDAK